MEIIYIYIISQLGKLGWMSYPLHHIHQWRSYNGIFCWLLTNCDAVLVCVGSGANRDEFNILASSVFSDIFNSGNDYTLDLWHKDLFINAIVYNKYLNVANIFDLSGFWYVLYYIWIDLLKSVSKCKFKKYILFTIQ